MMRYRKLSITMPEDVAAQVEEAATRSGLSASAWISRAAAEWAAVEAGIAALDETEQETGPVPPEVTAQAKADLAAAEAHLLARARRAG